MKIALLTVFASMALGWLASAGGGISSFFAFFFLPLFLSAVFAFEGLARHRAGGFEVRSRDSVPLLQSWPLLASLSLLIMAVFLLPASSLGILDKVRLTIAIPLICLEILLVAVAIKKGLLSPGILAGHLLVFVAGFFIASVFYFGYFGSLFWGEAGAVSSFFCVCESRGASNVINLGISIILTIPLLLPLEYLNFRLNLHEKSENLWGPLSACFFLAGLLLIALVPFLSIANGNNLKPGSIYWEELRQGFSWALALSTMPAAAASLCMALIRCSKRELIFVSSFLGAVLLSVACSTWVYRYEIGGALFQVLGRYSCSVQCYSSIIERNPTAAWAYAARGTSHELRCQFKKAILDLQQAAKLAPREREYSEHLGALRIRLNQRALLESTK